MEKKSEPAQGVITSNETNSGVTKDSFEPLDPNDFHDELLKEKTEVDFRFESMAVNPDKREVVLDSYAFPTGEVKELVMDQRALMAESLRVNPVKNNLYGSLGGQSKVDDLGITDIRKDSLSQIEEAPETAEESGFFGAFVSGIKNFGSNVNKLIL